jgi:Zn-dependent protease
MVVDVYGSLWMTISRPAYYREAVGGPIFIGQMARDSARRGLDRWLYLMALINIAIMSFNLLPVPLLDGGHITLALLEGLRKKAVSGRTYMNFQKVGLVLVGTLFVFICPRTSCARSRGFVPSTRLPGSPSRLNLRTASAACLLAALALLSPGRALAQGGGELPDELA